MKSGNVFRIQKFSIHDGPGIRIAVFLKGCPLDCFWCHNPEGCLPVTEIIYHEDRCIMCGRCMKACDNGAIDIRNGKLNRYRTKCTIKSSTGKYTKDDTNEPAGANSFICSACSDVCPCNALESIGSIMTVSEVMDEIAGDLIFYEESGGGVTFTGGEPFAQFEFLQEILMYCCKEGFHTAIETSGYTSWENLRNVTGYTGLFLYDLKLMDEVKHIKYTGVSNQLILENLKRLAAVHGNIKVRIPLIPGVNDDEENVENTCLYLNSIHLGEVDILPYHNTGLYKYEQLGLRYRLVDTYSPDKEVLDTITDKFRKYGISVNIGG